MTTSQWECQGFSLGKVPALSPAAGGRSSVRESTVAKKATAADELHLRATPKPKSTSA